MIAPRWQELRLQVDAAQHDSTQELLQSAGAQALTTTALDDDELFEPLPGETPLWPRVAVSALFSRAQNLAPLVLLLEAAGIDCTLHDVTEQDWLERGSQWQAARFGKRLWVCPTGTRPTADDDTVVVELDPGLAFGTGSHPTTRLCLEWLDAHPPINQVVIDYGCGSGILAIAAVKLGAPQVQAIDIDPQALTATQRNAERNGAAARIRTAPAATPPLACDLLVANILLRPLILLVDCFASCIRPGGDLVLSGLLASQVPDVQTSYSAAFALNSPTTLEGWALLHGTRRGNQVTA